MLAGDLPQGAGLSSSASLEVAIGQAFERYGFIQLVHFCNVGGREEAVRIGGAGFLTRSGSHSASARAGDQKPVRQQRLNGSFTTVFRESIT